jgi:CheY-like chemotaxis protein
VKRTSRPLEPVAACPAPDRDLAGALHEVSNALTVVLGWLEQARKDTQGTPAAEALEVAWLYAGLGHSISRRAVGASINSESEVRSALRLSQGAVRGVLPVAKRRSVQVLLERNVDCAAADLTVAHASVLQQILLNLLLNAIAFTPAGGAVSLGFGAVSGRARFTVADGGPGVPLERRASIFRRGQSTRPGGAGVGLSHARALAESRGGVLSLVEGEHDGARFELEWPIAEAPSTPMVELVVPPTTSPLRVLLLEDDPAVMSLLEVALMARGMELTKLSSREELYAFTTRPHPVDVALVDLSPVAQAPEEALARLRRAAPTVPVFLISGSSLPQNVELSVAGWIRKPFELSEIFRALGEVATARCSGRAPSLSA